jgi:hypothetical protein
MLAAIITIIHREPGRCPHPRAITIAFPRGARPIRRQARATCSRPCTRCRPHRRTAASQRAISSRGQTASSSALCVHIPAVLLSPPTYVRSFFFHFSGPPCADCDTTTTAAATVHDAVHQPRCLGARRGQPLVLSSSTEPAFPIAGVAEFLSRRPRISLCFRATSVFPDPLWSPTIRYSRYPTLVSLRPSAFDFVSTIIPSRIGTSSN